jgi:hypothetical protein
MDGQKNESLNVMYDLRPSVIINKQNNSVKQSDNIQVEIKQKEDLQQLRVTGMKGKEEFIFDNAGDS